MTERYMVTGAQGFIGRYLVKHLLVRFPNSKVLGIGRSPEQHSAFLHTLTCGNRRLRALLPPELRDLSPERYLYIPSDLSSSKIAGVIRDFHPTGIIHLAGLLRGVSEEVVFKNNVRSMQGLLESIYSSGVRIQLFLFASSGGVYGKPEILPITETVAAKPIDRYAQSKLAAETLACTFARETRTPIAIARIFNVLGPGQDELHFAGRIAGQIAAILAGKSRPVIRTHSLLATRDFLDARDVCSALATILEQRIAGVCNVGSGIETRIDNLLQAFLRYADLQDKVEVPQETGHNDPIPRHFANIQLLRSAGFTPEHALQGSVGEMVDYRTRLHFLGAQS